MPIPWTGIILGFLFVAFFLVLSGVIAGSDDDPERFWVVALLIVVGFFAFVVYTGERQEEAYRQAQIDCQTGDLKYELMTRPDSTREWVLPDTVSGYPF